jgi:REP-associated tyrosine transposase
MGLRYPDQKHHNCFFVTTTFNKWAKFGEIEGVYQCMQENLVFYSDKYDASLSGYVFMPSHLHLLVFIDGNTLSCLIRDYKKYISQIAFKKFGIDTKTIWMPRYDRVAIATLNVFRDKLNYIHYNPVRGNLTKQPTQWPWSSAGYYLAGKRGNVPIWDGWSTGECHQF